MIVSFLTGALLKIYDDFVDDEHYITNEHIITILQYIQICLVTLLLSNDFWLCFVFTLFNLACAFSSSQEYEGPHVFAYAFVAPILLIASWKTRTTLKGIDYAVISCIVGMGLMEAKLFPEETSILKGLSRFSGTILFITVAVCFPELSPSMYSLLIGFSGYSTASSMAQMLKLFCLPPCLT
jgi:hypothetical protein